MFNFGNGKMKKGSKVQNNNININDNDNSINNMNDDDDGGKNDYTSNSDTGSLTITSSSDLMEVVKSLNETVRALSQRVSFLEDEQVVLKKELKLMKSFRNKKPDSNNNISSSKNNSNNNMSTKSSNFPQRKAGYRLTAKAIMKKKASAAKNMRLSVTSTGGFSSAASGGASSGGDGRGGEQLESFNAGVSDPTQIVSPRNAHAIEVAKSNDDKVEKVGKVERGDQKRFIERGNSYGGLFLDYDDDSEDEDGIAVHGLGHDTYSLLKVTQPLHTSWNFAVFVILIQMALLAMILSQQILDSREETEDALVFNIPFQVKAYARAGQFFAIVFTVAMSRDIFMPVKELSSLWLSDETEWTKVTGELGGKKAITMWLVRIFMPNLLQIMVGSLALLVSFVIIIQADDVIQLFADFAAMSVIAELDNIAFWFAENGYAGDVIMFDVEVVQDVLIRDKMVKFFGVNLRMILFLFLLLGVNVPMVPVIMGQRSGAFFYAKYPDCPITNMNLIRKTFGNGNCDGGIINTYGCEFDGGDCIAFNIAYPNCRALEPSKVGDGECDDEYNIKECLYDGGDCCEKKDDSYLADEICHAGLFYTERCLFDGGDCDDLRRDFPNCPEYSVDLTTDNGEPIEIGNGVCNHDKENIKEYMNEECGWVFGDCLEVRNRAIEMEEKYPDCYGVTDYWKIGDGNCDSGPYLKEECGFDEFDCCTLDHSKIGDGTCDSLSSALPGLPSSWPSAAPSIAPVMKPFNVSSWPSAAPSIEPFDVSFVPSQSPSSQPSAETYLNKECGYEGYDCCKFPELLKNGQCRDDYNDGKSRPLPTEEVVNNPQCGFDSIDCIVVRFPGCTIAVGERLGDGVCNGGEYNVEECGYDDGDCIEFNERYPLCLANENDFNKQRFIPYLGDGLCNKKELNNIECGYDGGDCVSFNAKYPNCETSQPYKIGDGFCNGDQFNTTECEYDGGDCICEGACVLPNYPNCNVPNPSELGDGACRGGAYNTAECGWDGMDCFLINLKMHVQYPGCIGLANPDYIGDGKCHGDEYNTEICGYDGGDCIEYNEKYPNCKENFPDNVGNGFCNPDQNIIECGWDGGDCLLEEYPNCHAKTPTWIGDGNCDWEKPFYNTVECGWDGGDCLVPGFPNCRTNFPSSIGNGICTLDYNTTSCGFDGGDCLIPYPLCDKEDRDKLGDGHCNYSSISSENLNTVECGWDGGDCIIPDYPDCHAMLPLELFQNGNCTVGYNTFQCGWDGGDCIVEGFPTCRTNNPTSIGDGNCTLDYNTTSCGFDGGDCLIPYSLCPVTDRGQLGDGFCNTGYFGPLNDDYYDDDYYGFDTENLNTEECGWDAGDCIIPGYPDCHIAYPPKFHKDGNCDQIYNNPECGYDGGDC